MTLLSKGELLKTFFIIAGCILGFLLVVMGLGWLSAGNEFFMFKFFAPRQEAVRREVFEQSKAYNQGMAQELDGFYLEYSKGTPEQKAAIKSIVLHLVADYPVDKLPAHLQTFINDLRNPITTHSF